MRSASRRWTKAELREHILDEMETLSGFTSEASLRYDTPSTPPYTPQRVKRRLSRGDSPASVQSTVRPTETTSPVKKPAKRRVVDEVRVEEVTEADLGYIADIEVVYADELEEAESRSDSDTSLPHNISEHGIESDDDSDARDSVAEQLSRLGCEDQEEVSFERKRKQKRARRRAESRLFKRPHSLIVNPDAEVTDLEAMPDHDLPGSARRLRRRTRGPDEMVGVPSDGAASSAGSGRRAPGSGGKSGDDRGSPLSSKAPASAEAEEDDDEMEVDGGRC